MNRTLQLACCAGLALPALARAGGGQLFSEWTGPFNGNFNIPSHWSTFNVPDSPGEVFLLAGGTAMVTSSITVDKFGLQNGTLNINPNVLVGVRTQTDNAGVTGIFGGGIIAMNSNGFQTTLRLVGAAGSHAVHGNSGNPTSILMTNTTANVIDGSSSGVLLVNEGLITGSGQVGANLLNLENTATGVFDSTHPTGNLIINDGPGGMVNRGILRTTGGTLTILNSGITQLGAGEIAVNSIDPAIVNISNSTIVGGRFNTSGSPPSTHYIQVGGNSELDGVLIEGATRIPANNLCFVRNGFTTPGSKVFLDSDGFQSTLRLLNDQTFSGAGGIECSNTLANVIDAGTSGLILTNDLLGGIRGAFRLGTNLLSVVNNTVIESTLSAGVVIDPPAAVPFDNNGVLRSTPGSPMTLLNGNFENTGGMLIAQHPSVFTLQNVRIDNGTLSGEQPGGRFDSISNSTVANVTLTGSTIFRMPADTLTRFEGGIVNQGRISMESDGFQTTFRTLNGDVTLTGGGIITGSNTQANVLDAGVTNQRLTNQDNTIRGSFSIGANTLQVVNNHLIEAQGAAGIRIDPPGTFGFDNNSVVRALAGSAILIINGFFDNDMALLEAQDNSTITFQSATINAGTLRSLGSGFFNSISGSELINTTLDTGSRLVMPANNLTLYQGTVTNRATIAMESNGFQTTFRTLNGDVTLTGGGIITGSNTQANVLDAGVTNQRLTNQDNTIRGSFSIGANTLQVVNNHLIEAQGAAGIRIDPPGTFGFDNNSVVRALTGSAILIINGFFDNDMALLEAQDDSTITFQSATINAGTLRSLGSGFFSSISGSELINTTLDTGSRLVMPANTLTLYQGTVTNRATIAMESNGFQTTFRTFNGDVTLTGGGIITGSNTQANVLDASATNQRLTNQDNIIRGAFRIGGNTLSVTNRGSIIADEVAGITIDPPTAGSFLNDVGGLLRAQGGNITIASGPFTTVGSVIADVGRLINRTAGDWIQTGGNVLAHGEIQVAGTYQLQGGALGGSGLVDSNVTNSGGALSPGASGGTLTIEGNYVQQAGGRFDFEVASTSDPALNDTLNIMSGSATLGGTIRISRLDGFVPPIGQGFTILTTPANMRFGTFATIDSPDAWHVEYFHNAAVAVFDGIGAGDCAADFNGDGNLDPDDLSDYITCFFTQAQFPGACVEADFNSDGNIDPDDLSDYITAFFSGC